MNKSLRIFPLIIILLFILPTLSIAGEFKVTGVYDGDTIKAEGHDIEIKVRLVGITLLKHPGKSENQDSLTVRKQRSIWRGWFSIRLWTSKVMAWMNIAESLV